MLNQRGSIGYIVAVVTAIVPISQLFMLLRFVAISSSYFVYICP